MFKIFLIMIMTFERFYDKFKNNKFKYRLLNYNFAAAKKAKKSQSNLKCLVMYSHILSSHEHLDLQLTKDDANNHKQWHVSSGATNEYNYIRQITIILQKRINTHLHYGNQEICNISSICRCVFIFFH